MGHIIIISILFVNSLLIKNSSTCLTEELLKVFKDRAFGLFIALEVIAITQFFNHFLFFLAQFFWDINADMNH